MRRLHRPLFTALALAVLGSAPALAQTGAITGRVTDAAEAKPVVGAAVLATSAVGTSGSALTASDGTFRIGGLPAGTYDVVVSYVGYETRTVRGVRVADGQTADLALTLNSVAFQLNPVVVTASRKAEKAVDAPATVAVVDTRTIEERPTVTPVDHLRETPGVDIFNSGIQSTNVVVRGFNNIFSGAVMALTDYRIAGVPSLRVNFLHFIPANDDDIERMEVVLGPGSALYGPNTADGVIHIITKSPLDRQGTTVSVGGGTRSVFQTTFRTAQKLSDKFGLKFSGQYFKATEFPYVDPVEVAERAKFHGDSAAFFRQQLMLASGISAAEADRRIAGIGNRDNDVNRWSGELRADWRPTPTSSLVLEGGVTNVGKAIELTGLGAAQAKDWRYSYAQARYSWNRFFAQAYVNASDAGDTYLLRNGVPITDRSKLYVAQVQHGVSLGTRENLTYGADFIYTNPITGGTINGIYEDDDQTTEIGGYLQSETALSSRWNLLLAGRIDHSTAIPDAVFSPRAGLVFKPTQTQAFRVTYNRAFSTPSSLNQFLDLGSAFPDPRIGQLGYSLRIQGTGKTGFHFRGANGGYQMVSPFTPTPGQKLPADAASMWAAAIQVAAAANPQLAAQPQLVQYLASLKPTAADISTMWVNPAALGAPAPLSSLDLPDVAPIRESVSNTFEVGYQGVLGDKLLLAADAWYSKKERLTTALTLSSPLLFLNGQQTAAFLVPRLTQYFQAAGLPAEQAAGQATALAGQLAPGLAGIPLGAITAPEVDARGAQLLTTYYNVDDNLKVYGADFAATYLLSPAVSLKGTLSLVNKDLFETARGDQVPLNAPKTKGTLSITYRNERHGFNGELRGRFAAGFPVRSGVYNGTLCLAGPQPSGAEDCVDGSALLDLDLGYTIPRTRATVQLAVQNLLDQDYRSFPGVPTTGMLALLRVKYEF